MFEFLKRKKLNSVFKAKNKITESWVDRDLKRFEQYPLLNDKVIKAVFDNVRNIGLSALPLLAAKDYFSLKVLQNQLFPWLNTVVSVILFLLGIALFALNAFHGLKKILELVKTPQSRYFLIPLLMFTYIFIAAVISAHFIYARN